MRVRKSLIIVTSMLGVYSTVRRYQKKMRPARVNRKQINTQQANKYMQFTSSEVREQFKNRIAAGEWLSQNEYTDMMFAMRQNNISQA